MNENMKKVILIVGVLVFLGSCANQRGIQQKAHNLPPVYVSLKNILSDNGIYGRPLVIINGLLICPREVVEMKIDINTLIRADVLYWHTERLLGGGNVLFIATERTETAQRRRMSPTRRERRPEAEVVSDWSNAQISLQSILTDNGLCENCLVIINEVVADDLTMRIDINAITTVMNATDILLRSSIMHSRDCLLIITTK